MAADHTMDRAIEDTVADVASLILYKIKHEVGYRDLHKDEKLDVVETEVEWVAKKLKYMLINQAGLNE